MEGVAKKETSIQILSSFAFNFYVDDIEQIGEHNWMRYQEVILFAERIIKYRSFD